jgi:hypothetical protein
MEKLGASDRTQAVAIAVRRGIIKRRFPRGGIDRYFLAFRKWSAN